jgi:hypothetical protein
MKKERMDTIRTDVQKQADDQLEAAIQNCLKAYGITDEDEIIADFVVLLATNKLHGDGVVQTSYPILLPGSDIPWYKVLGLIQAHEVMAKTRMMSGTDNG